MAKNLALLLALTFLLPIACGDDGTAPQAADPAVLTVVAGDGQTGTVGAVLQVPLTVEVTDSDGNPVEAVPVQWSIVGGGGRVAADFTETGADGRTAVEWHLGTEAGENRVEATVEGVAAVTFSATGQAGSPTNVELSRKEVAFRAVGDTLRLGVTVVDRYGNVVADAPSWSSSDTSVALVDAEGLVTSRGSGEAVISATMDTVEAEVRVLVEQELVSVRIDSDTERFSAIGDTVRFVATGLDRNGQAVAHADLVWASSDTAVLTVDAAGLVTSQGAGEAVVAAMADTVRAEVLVVVEQDLAAVRIESETYRFSALGDTVRFTATGLDPNGYTVPEPELVWVSSDTAVAAVDPAGIVTSRGVGRAVVGAVAATADTVRAEVQVVVEQRVAAVSIAPDTARFTALGDTLRLAATVLDPNGNAVLEPELTWTSLDTTVAMVDANGLVTSRGRGETMIEVASDSARAEAPVAVAQEVASVRIESGDVRFNALGDTLRLEATVLDYNDHAITDAAIDWRTQHDESAVVDDAGLITAVGSGWTRAIAEADGVADTITIRVNQKQVSLRIEPDAGRLTALGDTLHFTATALDPNGYAIAGVAIEWRTQDEESAVVDQTGLVTALRNGWTRLIAETDSHIDTAMVRIRQVADRAELEPKQLEFGAIGESVQFTYEVMDRNGHRLEEPDVTWSTHLQDRVQVDDTGLTTAVSPGWDLVIAEAEGLMDTVRVTVPTKAAGVVGTEGGTVEYPGGITVEVPAGAYSTPVVVTITKTDPIDGDLTSVSDPYSVSIDPVESGGFGMSAMSTRTVGSATSAVVAAHPPVHISFNLIDGCLEEMSNVLIGATIDEADLWEHHYSYNGSVSCPEGIVQLPVRGLELFKSITVQAFKFDGGQCNEAYDLRKAPEDRRGDGSDDAIVFIHGWQASLAGCETWKKEFDPDEQGAHLFRNLDYAGLDGHAQYWRYTYPTFNSIDRAAEDLAAQLLREFGGDQRVVLIGHSMGGLVARAAVELYGAQDVVDRVITLGTPHEGAELADPAFLLEFARPSTTCNRNGAWDMATPYCRHEAYMLAGFSVFKLTTPGARDLRPADRGGEFIERLARQGPPDPDFYTTFNGIGNAREDLEPCARETIGWEICIGAALGMTAHRRAGLLPSDGIVTAKSASWDPRTVQLGIGAEYDHFELARGAWDGTAFRDPDPLFERVAEVVAEVIATTPDTPPTVSITSPTHGDAYTKGESITFQGSATDSHGEALTGTSLVWTSDISGQIGMGTSFDRSDLAEGTHAITLEATDADGTSGSLQITIDVEASAVDSPSVVNYLQRCTAYGGGCFSAIIKSAPHEKGGTNAEIWIKNLQGTFSKDLSSYSQIDYLSIRRSGGRMTASSPLTVTTEGDVTQLGSGTISSSWKTNEDGAGLVLGPKSSVIVGCNTDPTHNPGEEFPLSISTCSSEGGEGWVVFRFSTEEFWRADALEFRVGFQAAIGEGGGWLSCFAQTFRDYLQDNVCLKIDEYQLISGTITSGGSGVSGVEVTFSDGPTVTSQSDGWYWAPVAHRYSGTATPSRSGYTFTPVSRAYNNLTEPKSGEDYTAGATKTYALTIQGEPSSVPIAVAPADVNGNADGTTTFVREFERGTEVTVVAPASVVGAKFHHWEVDGAEAGRSTRLTITVTDHRAVRAVFATNKEISGTVATGDSDCDPIKGGRRCLGGATVSFSDGPTVTTEADGTYSASVTYGYSGAATVTKDGYSFTPNERTYSNVTESQSGENYLASGTESLFPMSEDFSSPALGTYEHAPIGLDAGHEAIFSGPTKVVEAGGDRRLKLTEAYLSIRTTGYRPWAMEAGTAVVTISLDLTVEQGPSSFPALITVEGLREDGSNVSPAGVEIHPDGEVQANVLGSTIAKKWEIGEVLALVFQLDLEADRCRVSADGGDTFTSWSLLEASCSVEDLNYIDFTPGSTHDGGNGATYYVDNIRIVR